MLRKHLFKWRKPSKEAACLIQLVDQLIQLLREFPHMVTVWHSPIRKAGLRKTKYGLFYVPESTRLVIIGVQDLRAAPDRLSREMKRRLP